MSKSILLITGICVILLTSFALACCCPIPMPWGGNTGGKTDDNKTSTIKGACFITTSEGKQPVANINVKVGDSSTTTDKDGNFEVTGLAAGTYDVQAAGGDTGMA